MDAQQINAQRIAELETLIKNLNQVKDEVIQVRTNYNNALTALKELGFDSLGESDKELTKIEAQIEKRLQNLDTSFGEFLKKHGSLLQK